MFICVCFCVEKVGLLIIIFLLEAKLISLILFPLEVSCRFSLPAICLCICSVLAFALQSPCTILKSFLIYSKYRCDSNAHEHRTQEMQYRVRPEGSV